LSVADRDAVRAMTSPRMSHHQPLRLRGSV